ncbi:hypothetical protein Pcinc_009638 [Petrolisthes cinctipes]|uniref:Reverse transcriptase domain-containing protein n=1 Tax=Petrolisthes cinctipes TaxID=88211 RepID=A0AAE1KW53_PETCI|nr:hypothetical protein Pcinc_009638 [Petrolisthes cinctipes]
MMGPVSAVSHRQGFRLLRYLDDWLLLAHSEQEAIEATSFLLQLCASLGIQVNWEKSSLTPSQSMTYLGMEIRSPLLKVFPTQRRIEKLHHQIQLFLSVLSPTAKVWLILLDASNLGWGASVLHNSVSSLWIPHKRSLHINLLELRAVRLGLLHFREQVHGKTVAVFSDNTTALSYLAKEGGTCSGPLNAEDHAIQIITQFVKGSSNVLADYHSRQDQIISTEWMLHQDICSQLWRLWSYPTVDLFATRLNFRLPNFVSPFRDPMAIATDAFLYNWDHQDLYAFPPFPLIRKVINKLRAASCTNLILITPFWTQKEWFPDLVQASVDSPRLLPHRRDLLRQPHVRRFHQALPMPQLDYPAHSQSQRVFPPSYGIPGDF